MYTKANPDFTPEEAVEIVHTGYLHTKEEDSTMPHFSGYVNTVNQKPKASRTKQWFNLAVPNPTYDNVRMQLACHFEEVDEMLNELEFTGTAESDRQVARSCIQAFVKKLKAKEADVLQPKNPEELLDSICDQRVTGIGVAHMLQMDIDGAIDEVDNSNFSKFVNGEPVFNDQGKIAKGPEYFKVNLKPFV